MRQRHSWPVALPDGDSIVVPILLSGDAHLSMKRHLGEASEGPARDLLHAVALERASRICAVDGVLMAWNAEAARYEMRSNIVIEERPVTFGDGGSL